MAINVGVNVKRYALCLGVNEVADAEPLLYAHDDATAMAELFKRLQFATRVECGKNATIETLLSVITANRLYDATPEMGEEDQFLLFFAGHGEQTAGAHKLCLSGAQPGTAINAVFVHDILTVVARNVRARNFICVVDACRNTAAARTATTSIDTLLHDRDVRSVQAMPLGRTVAVLYGCGPKERCWEDKRFGHGVLTHHLIQAFDSLESARQGLSFNQWAVEAAKLMTSWRNTQNGATQVAHIEAPAFPELWLKGGEFARLALSVSEEADPFQAGWTAEGNKETMRSRFVRLRDQKSGIVYLSKREIVGRREIVSWNAQHVPTTGVSALVFRASQPFEWLIEVRGREQTPFIVSCSVYPRPSSASDPSHVHVPIPPEALDGEWHEIVCNEKLAASLHGPQGYVNTTRYRFSGCVDIAGVAVLEGDLSRQNDLVSLTDWSPCTTAT
jgi:hypothetical protein